MATVTQTCLLGFVVLLVTLVSGDAYRVSDINQYYGYDIEPEILAKLGNCDFPTALKKLREYGKQPKDNSGSDLNWYENPTTRSRWTTYSKIIPINLGDYGKYNRLHSFEGAGKKYYSDLGSSPNDMGYYTGDSGNRFKNGNALNKHINSLGEIDSLGKYPEWRDNDFAKDANLNRLDDVHDFGRNVEDPNDNNLEGNENLERYLGENGMGMNDNELGDNGLRKNDINFDDILDFERYPGENVPENNANQFGNNGDQFGDLRRENNNYLRPIDNFERYLEGNAPGNNDNQFRDTGVIADNNNYPDMDDFERYSGGNALENNTIPYEDNSFWKNNNNLQGLDDLVQYPVENNFEPYRNDGDNDNGFNVFTTTPVVPFQIDRTHKQPYITNEIFHTNPSVAPAMTTISPFQYGLATKMPNQNAQQPFRTDNIKNPFIPSSNEDCEFPVDDVNEMRNSLLTQPKDSYEMFNTRPAIATWSSGFKPNQNSKSLLAKYSSYARTHPIPKYVDGFARAKQMLYSNTLSYTLLRDILHTLFPNASWNMSNAELLADILYVLQYKNNSDFSKLINGLFDYKFGRDHNALYFVLGLKGQVPSNFDLWALLKNLFPDSFANEMLSNNNQNMDYIIPKLSSPEDVNDSSFINKYLTPIMSELDRLKHTLLNSQIDFLLFKEIWNIVFPNSTLHMSDAELLKDIYYILTHKDMKGTDFTDFVNGLYNYKFGGDYNALYYALGIKGPLPKNFNLLALLKSLFPHRFAGEVLSNNNPIMDYTIPKYSSFEDSNNNPYINKLPGMIFAPQNSWRDKMKHMHYSNKFNYALLRNILRTLFPNASWNMSNAELFADILYVLQHKNNSDFSKLINGLFDYKFGKDHNALYFVLGLKGQVPSNFDLWALLKSLFPNKKHFLSQLLQNNNKFNQIIPISGPIFSSSEDFNNGASINAHPGQVFLPQMSWRERLNSKEYADGFPSEEEANSNESNLSFNKEFGDSDHFIGCVMFKILKRTFPDINETFISKVVLNTVTDYIKKNNLYTNAIRQLS